VTRPSGGDADRRRYQVKGASSRWLKRRAEPHMIQGFDRREPQLFGMMDNSPYPIDDIILDSRNVIFDGATEEDIKRYLDWMKSLKERGIICAPGATQAGAPQMYLDLSEFNSLEDYIAACRKIHKGNNVRDAIRAGRLGYCTKFINHQNHLGDILEIALSAPDRQGRRLPDDYFLTVAEQGGYPPDVLPVPVPSDSLIWMRWFGVFLPKPGHRQGDLALDEQLVAYAWLRRLGETLWINRFIGHAAHLASGMMHQGHFDIIAFALQGRSGLDEDQLTRGIRYVLNGGYQGLLPDGLLGRTGGDGLLRQKLRMLYRPGILVSDDDFDQPNSGANR
jgi:hypothetical protein